MFDFSKYYKNMSAKTDAKIELTDVPIKSDSSAATDDEGKSYDATLNEYVTKNIDYIVTGIDISNINGIYGTSLFDGSDDDKSDLLLQNAKIIGENGSSDDDYSFRLFSSLDDAEYELSKSGGDRISQVSVQIPYTNDNITYYASAILGIAPKYTLINNTFPVADDSDVYSHILAMFGLFGSGCETYKWAKSSKYKSHNCVMSNSSLTTRIDSVSESVRPRKYEVEISTYYDLTDPDSSNDTDISVPNPALSKKMTSSSVVSADTVGFCQKMTNYGYMMTCEGDNRTPFLPSIRDAFEAYYQPKEELADEFNEAFDDVLENIKSLWFMKSKLKSSTRSKIKAVSASDWKYATESELKFEDPTSDNRQWLLDIESILCNPASFNLSEGVNLPTLISPFYTGDQRNTRLTTNQKYTGIGSIQNSFTYSIPATYLNTGYSFDTAGYYDDSNVTNTIFSYTEYSLSDLMELLTNLYDTSIAPCITSKSNQLSYPDIYKQQFLTECCAIAVHSATLSVKASDIAGNTFSSPIGYDNTGSLRDAYIASNPNLVVKVITWAKGAALKDGLCANSSNTSLIPLLQENGSSEGAHIKDKLSIVDDVDDIVDRLSTAINIMMLTLGSGAALAIKAKLHGLEDSVREFKSVTDKIKYFEYYTADSVFNTKERILSDSKCYKVTNGLPITATYPARFLIPTKLYKKVRVKKRILHWTRTITKMKCIGIRWTEIRFINVGLYDKYPKDTTVPSNTTMFESSYKYDTYIITEKELPSTISTGNMISLKINGMNDLLSCEVVDSNNLSLLDSVIVPKSGTTEYIQTGLDGTKSGNETTTVSMSYTLPHFPYDEEIRGYAFGLYGSLDQSKYAVKDRDGNVKNGKEGWKIFLDSSSELSDMRKGINIYPSVAHLIRSLKEKFGKNRVALLETSRSMEDQSSICLGGNESAFLSWHNYGLAAKIMIYQEDLKTPIDDGSTDMLELIDVAQEFTEKCLSGEYGAHLNVVWCGRLAVGANLFDWEFLPIGVTHKDAPLFRSSYISQRDPIMDYSYVNALEYAKNPGNYETNVQWISNQSDIYKNALSIGDAKYVPPKSIRNFAFPKNLPLINVIEFLRMIQLKMNAYGTTMPNKGDMYEWISKNRTSYEQLLLYFGMIGNLQSFRALIAGEYITRYRPIVSTYYLTDSVEFVKEYLGDSYSSVQIRADDMVDASYISLSDGRLHIPCMDGRPNLPLSEDNMFDQKRVTLDNYQRGRWIDGQFIVASTEDEYISDSSVIGGYDDFEAVGGDAYLLHSYIADQIKEEFDNIVNMFEGYNGDLMFDSFQNGPYADKYDQLENEFGIISAQDLIDFDKLKNMIVVTGINKNTNGTAITSDGTEKTIYETVVSNAEVSGMRLASLSSEHLEIDPLKESSMTVEDVYKIINSGTAPTANEIINYKKQMN